jgi:hypothetical protein
MYKSLSKIFCSKILPNKIMPKKEYFAATSAKGALLSKIINKNHKTDMLKLSRKNIKEKLLTVQKAHY